VDSFGPEKAATGEALRRLVEWIIQFSGPEEALAAAGQGVEFTESRPLGGVWALDALWSRLGVGGSARRLLAGRGQDDSAERVLFALVANRALAPSPALSAARWVSEDVFISGLPATTDDACCRAADWLAEIGDALEREVSGRVAALPDQDVALLFFGATAACPGGDTDDGPAAPGGDGKIPGVADADGGGAWLRAYGKHADHREYPPQVVIGMAVTRDGIPVRTWCWQQATAQPALIRQVRDDMRDWAPSRVIWVSSSGGGFASAETRRCLRENGDYIVGEKLRSGSAEAAAALSRQGRYQNVTANLRVKEVRVSNGERFIICHDPGRAACEAADRARTLARLTEFIRHTDTLGKDKRAEAYGAIAARPGLNRYLRVTPGGRLRIHAKSVRAEANLDGKYLLRASGPDMAAEDIAKAYTGLLEAERGWRAMNQLVGPPAGQHSQERIRAHVLLCWLALLLARVAENACHAAWPALRRELDRIAVGTFTGPAGTFRQRTQITDAQRDIFARLGIDPPPRIYQLTPAASSSAPAQAPDGTFDRGLPGPQGLRSPGA